MSKKLNKKQIEALELFVAKVSFEGIDYALANYSPEGCPQDFMDAAENARIAIAQFESLMEMYMEEYDLEYS